MKDTAVLDTRLNTLIGGLGKELNGSLVDSLKSLKADTSKLSGTALQNFYDLKTLLNGDPISVMNLVNNMSFDAATIKTWQQTTKNSLADKKAIGI